MTSQSVIDVAILQTCRFAYFEAVEALYRRNVFMFNNASEIADFRSKGLRKVIVGQNSDQSQKLENVFQFQATPIGRLANIVFVFLIFTDRPDLQGNVPYVASRKESIMEAWSDLLFQKGQRTENERYSFPALKALRLDFEHLALQNEGGVAVSDQLEAPRSAC